MKKGVYFIVLMAFMSLFLAGCNKKSEIIYNIDENDVLNNPYEGKIKIKDNLSKILKDVTATRVGHKFLGWSIDGVNVITKDQNIEEKKLTVMPLFEKLNYTITYKIDGTKDIVQTYAYQESITPPNDIVKLGYEFNGWDKTVPNVMPAENLEFMAIFTIVDYDIDYDLDGGICEELILTYNVNTLPIDLPIPSKEGFIFEGFSLNDNLVFELTVNNLPEFGNIILTAKWKQDLSALEASGQDLIFIGHAGSYLGLMNSEEAFINAVNIKKYQAIECDLKQTKDGVFVVSHDDTFNGIAIANTNWEDIKDVEYTSTRGGIIYTTKLCTLERYLQICKEYNVYAVIELKYSLGINNNDTSRMDDLMIVIEDAEMLDKTIFLASQYKCLEWVRNNGYDEIPCQYLVNSMESESTLERCLTWNFDISFNIASPNSQEWIDRYHEAGIDVSCYTFNQYTSVSELQKWIDCGVDFVTCDVLTEDDIILPDREAIANLPTYKVTFIDNDGSIIKEAYVKEGYNAVPPFDPKKAGYKFIGWDKTFTNVTSNFEVNALYQIESYEIIYDANLNIKSIDSWPSKEAFIEEFYTDLFNWLDSRVGILPSITKIDNVYKIVTNSSSNGTATWSSIEKLKNINIYNFEQTIGTMIYKPIEGTNSEDYIPVDDNNYFLNTYPYRIKYQQMNAYLLNAIRTGYPAYSETFNQTSNGRVQIFFRFHQWQQGTTIPAFNNLPDKYHIEEITGVMPILPTTHTIYNITDEFVLEEAICEGYRFMGWYLNPDCTGEQVMMITEGTTGDIRLYAKWEKIL